MSSSSSSTRKGTKGRHAPCAFAPVVANLRHSRDSLAVAVGPESQVLTQLTHVELLRCVSQLGDDQRECNVLRFLPPLVIGEELLEEGLGILEDAFAAL